MKEARNHTATLDRNRSRVIEVAQKAFETEGIKSVTMDDIAHRLTMSKRTIYQLFADKEDLLLACMQEHVRTERERLNRLGEELPNVIQVILMEFKTRIKNFQKVQLNIFAEIKKYPRVMEYLQTSREAGVADAVAFFRRGIEQGVFRRDIDFNIVFPVIQQQVDYVMSNAAFSIYSVTELFTNTVMVTIRGCTTPQGAGIIDDFMKDFNNESTAD